MSIIISKHWEPDQKVTEGSAGATGWPMLRAMPVQPHLLLPIDKQIQLGNLAMGSSLIWDGEVECNVYHNPYRPAGTMNYQGQRVGL